MLIKNIFYSIYEYFELEFINVLFYSFVLCSLFLHGMDHLITVDHIIEKFTLPRYINCYMYICEMFNTLIHDYMIYKSKSKQVH